MTNKDVPIPETEVQKWTDELEQAINDEIDEEVLGLKPRARKRFMRKLKQGMVQSGVDACLGDKRSKVQIFLP